jgi:hypothetical protein
MYNWKYSSFEIDKMMSFLVDGASEEQLEKAATDLEGWKKKDIFDFVAHNRIMAEFIKQSSNKDNALEMWNEVKELLKNHMTEEDHLEVVNLVENYEYGEARLLYPSKIEETRRLTSEELIKYGYEDCEKSVGIVERKDGMDELALKDLLLLLKGKEWKDINLGAGFFNKYVENIEGSLVFLTNEGKLDRVRVWPHQGTNFSPLRATLATINSRHSYDRIFVVTKGAVSVPNMNETPTYEEGIPYPVNFIKAGETFLVRFTGVTRLHFTPFNCLEVHPMDGHGSCLIGTTSLYYQSVLFDELEELKTCALFLNYMNMRNKENVKGPVFQDAAFANWRIKRKLTKKSPLEIMKENHPDFMPCVRSITGDTDFTLYLAFFLLKIEDQDNWGSHVNLQQYDEILMHNFGALTRKYRFNKDPLNFEERMGEGLLDVAGEHQVLLDTISVTKAMEELNTKLNDAA